MKASILGNLLKAVGVAVTSPESRLRQTIAHVQALGLWAHAAHLAAKGESFGPDHALYGEIYSTAQAETDSLIERCIGLHGDTGIADPEARLFAAGAILAKFGKPSEMDCDEIAEAAAEFNELVCDELQETIGHMRANGGLTAGLDNLLSGMCDTHETFGYKLGQRVAEDEDDGDDSEDD